MFSRAFFRRAGWLLAPLVPLWSAPSSAEPEPPIVLALRGDALDVERLRAALHGELGRDVVLESEARPSVVQGVLTVSYREGAGELAVAWDSGGQTVTRVVAAPSDAALLESDAALLAGNLARAQVEDLLPAREPPAPQIVVAPVAGPPPPPVAAPQEAERWHATAGVFYPLATHYGHPDVTSSLDFNLLHGRVGAIDGAQIGGVNVVHREQGPPAFMSGLQLGWLANLANGEVDGVQAASLFNSVSGDTEGAQLSFGANFARGSVTGLQSAWLLNQNRGLEGLQLALVNVAGDVEGVQIGLVNVAGHLRGVSVGLVNVADDVEGLPIGPFSVTRTGGLHLSAWAGTSGLGNAGIKFATRRTYTLLFGSYHRDFDREFLGGGFALGGSIDIGGGFRSDMDLAATYVVAPERSRLMPESRGYHEQLLQPRARLMLAYRAAPHVGLFVGAAAVGQVRFELGWEQVTARLGPEIFGGIEL